MEYKEIHLKEWLEIHFPMFFELYDGKGRDWATVSNALYERNRKNKEKVELLNEPLIIEASFFDIITQSIKGKESAIRLYDYFQILFRNLSSKLNDEQKQMIQKNLYAVLTNLDMRYQNFIGELSVLNSLINSGYTLLATEHRLDEDSKTKSGIDFKITNSNNDKEYLVEVVNIHLTDKNTVSGDKISLLLNGKLKKKYKKTQGNSSNDFYLVPVLWGTVEEVKRVHLFYSKTHFSLPNILDSLCFMSFTDTGNGRVIHKFGSIKTIFNESEI